MILIEGLTAMIIIIIIIIFRTRRGFKRIVVKQEKGLTRKGVWFIYIYLGELGEGDDGLRRRVVGTNGKIRLTIIYDDLKSELKLFVHEATGLPG